LVVGKVVHITQVLLMKMVVLEVLVEEVKDQEDQEVQHLIQLKEVLGVLEVELRIIKVAEAEAPVVLV